MDPADYTLSTGRVALELGVTHDTVAAWADRGYLPCWRTPGGHRRFRPADVEQFIASRTGQAEDGAA